MNGRRRLAWLPPDAPAPPAVNRGRDTIPANIPVGAAGRAIRNGEPTSPGQANQATSFLGLRKRRRPEAPGAAPRRGAPSTREPTTGAGLHVVPCVQAGPRGPTRKPALARGGGGKDGPPAMGSVRKPRRVARTHVPVAGRAQVPAIGVVAAAHQAMPRHGAARRHASGDRVPVRGRHRMSEVPVTTPRGTASRETGPTPGLRPAPAETGWSRAFPEARGAPQARWLPVNRTG